MSSAQMAKSFGMARWNAWQPVFLLALCLTFSSVLGLSNDGQILLDFKASVTDTNGALLSWNSSDALPCQWSGVTCDPLRQVTQINLYNTNLSGPVPAVLCKLPKLTNLVLALNYFNGTFPSEMLDCELLEVLDLSYNFIVGPLPADINKLQVLSRLDLSYNNFSGSIPPAFGALPELHKLTLSANLLKGSVPSFLGNLSSLVELILDQNPSLSGYLPPELGNLTQLEVLSVAWCAFSGPIPPALGSTNLTTLFMNGNSFSGPIPPELGNLRRLAFLDLSSNKLSGIITSELFVLRELQSFLLWKNTLSGEIPKAVSNLTSLRLFDVSMNQLHGSIPEELIEIPSLEVIQASTNFLTGQIPPGIGNLTKLNTLKFFTNSLVGSIPPNLGQSSILQNLDLSTNNLTGSIPIGLCDGYNLTDVILFKNNLVGGLPATLGNCPTLQRIRVEDNQLNGIVPVGLWGSPNVQTMYLANNFFEGSITSHIGNAISLSALILDNNQFSGLLPREIGSIVNLTDFSVMVNRLEGNLPNELGLLLRLSKLELAGNAFSGSIPAALSNCSMLDNLNLSNNHLTGYIPPELGSLQALNTLDLSFNHLSGPVPPQLGNLQLTEYNFSYNNLSGVLPSPFNINFLPNAFEGNLDLNLCGIDDYQCGVPSTSVHTSRHGHSSTAWAVGATLAFVVLVGVLGACYIWKRYNVQIYYWKHRRHDQDLTWSLKSFQRVSFIQEEVMDSLHENSLIGRGGSGKVYKAELSNGQVVAVKKLEAFRDNGFSAEVETLGKIRHRNIVKLLCCCSNQQCNLLVYDYMPNGSLGDYLHSTKPSVVLDWGSRFKIAFGAAEGLAYLHHDCVPPIVHRDVKSNNILLDEDFEAHLGDFGLARTFEAKSMSAVAGSYGYIAPEYAYTLKVTEKSDIYSFGVVLLELVSGRKPIQSEYGDLDIVRWVTKKIETKAGALEILDAQIREASREDMMLVLKVGLLCTSFLPSNRPSMRDVVQMLVEASPRNRSPQSRSVLGDKDCKSSLDPPLFAPEKS